MTNKNISSVDNDKAHVMHSKSDNIEIMIYDEADEVIRELFDLLTKMDKIDTKMI